MLTFAAIDFKALVSQPEAMLLRRQWEATFHYIDANYIHRVAMMPRRVRAGAAGHMTTWEEMCRLL